ncbi:MAG: D-alanine--D-alanine ligase [bacterium]
MNLSAKFRVAVLMGGISPEHDISLLSGVSIIKNLDRRKYNIKPIVVSKNDEWFVSKGFLKEDDFLPKHYFKKGQNPDDPEVKKMTFGQVIDQTLKKEADFIFIAMHGKFGEDGSLQAILDYIGLPYNGSGVAASALAMDKVVSKALFKKGGLLTPDHFVVKRSEWNKNKPLIQKDVEIQFGFPCVIKVPCGGSSIGVEIPQDKDQFRKSMDELITNSLCIIVERYISGREFTCGVLESLKNGRCEALPVVEIKPKESIYFDLKAKYDEKACDEIIPAQVSPQISNEIQHISLTAHEILGCRTYSRSDIILSDKDENLYIMETNTLPGFTENSLLPKEALAHGMSMIQLIDRIIETSRKKESS